MPAIFGGWTALAAVASGSAAVYTAVKSGREAEKAREAAKKRAGQELEFMEKQAGEYYQLSSQQMELQSQASQIKTLANLIGQARQPAAPQVFTLPAAKKYSAVEQINQAIDKMLRG